MSEPDRRGRHLENTWWRRFAAGPETATIGKAAAIVAAGIFVSRVLGLLRNTIMFALLGASAEKSLYDAAFTIPDYMFFLMAGGYLSITLVPILTRHTESGDPDAANVTFTAIFRVVTAGLIVLTLLMLLLAQPIVDLIFPLIQDRARLADLTRIALLSQVFFGAGALFMATQYARRRYLIPTLAPLIYNLGIILGGVIGALAGDPSPESFLWGGLAGAAVGSFGVQWFGAVGSGLRFVPSVPFRHPDLSEYFRLAIPLMIGQSVVALDEYWPKLFGQLAGQEAIGQLVGARQLNMVPVGLIATAAGVAAYPFLAQLVAQGRYRDLRATVLRSVTSGLTVAGLAVGLVVSLAYPIVRVLYQWGRFQIADTVIVGELLIFYALSIPFWVAHQVYGRAFYSMRRMWTPVIVGTVVTAVTVPLLFWFGREAGAGGVALGSSIGIALYAIGIGTAWHRTGSSAELGALFGAISRIAVTAGVSGFTTLVVAGALGTRFGSVVSLAISGLLGTVIYIVIGRLLALPGLEETIDRVRSTVRGFIARRDMDDTTGVR